MAEKQRQAENTPEPVKSDQPRKASRLTSFYPCGINSIICRCGLLRGVLFLQKTILTVLQILSDPG